MKAYLNPHLFFLLNQGETVVWDYKNHVQYSLTPRHYERLATFSSGDGSLEETPLDRELCEAGLISPEPYPDTEWGWDVLGKMYHMGTQNIHGEVIEDETLWVQEYQKFCHSVDAQVAYAPLSVEGERVNLPPAEVSLNQKTLEEALHNRATTRDFNGSPLSLKELSTFLFTVFGPIHGPWEELTKAGMDISGLRKAHPSGGALHPVEGYLAVFHVEGLEPGVYHYNVLGHYLTRVNTAVSYQELTSIFCGQFFLEGIAVGLFLVGTLEKVWQKYVHSRSYKDVYLDAGHLSQTALLSATNLGWRTWISAWFNDAAAASLLKVDGVKNFPLFFHGYGYGQKQAIPDRILKSLGSF
jgi:SagB-type dehydrogenase family enzyme